MRKVGAQKIRLRIFGTVQGVNFRSSACREAEALALVYEAKNESDGSVTIEVSGEMERIKQFILWCLDGPERARVERVEIGFLTIGSRLA